MLKHFIKMNSLLISQGVQSAVTKMLLPSIFTPNSLSNPVCLQCVRWRRKPRWLPVAKTKMYKVPPRKRHPVEEEAEVLRLFNNYRTSMKAIQFYLLGNIKSKTTAPEVIAEQQRLEQEEHDRCVALNNEWNESVAKLRQERTNKEIEDIRLKALEEVTEYQRKEEEELNKIEELVRKEKEKSKTFITPENIDEAIEKALNQTVDYNFCIDLKGNIYKGLRARPGVSEPEKHDDDGSSQKQAISQ